jgi:hypothetical protein
MVLSCPDYAPSNPADASDTRSKLLAIYASSSTPNLAVMKDVTLDPVSGHVTTSDLSSRYGELTTVMTTLTPADNGIPAVQVQTARDTALQASLQAEYCFYYGRYKWALNRWLEHATNRNASQSTQAADMLGILKTLNIRVIFIIEFMNYVAQTRAASAEGDAASIAALNATFNDEYASLQAVQAQLNKQNAIVTTQKEMVRYTATKNSAAMSTVLFWGVANVIALGAIGAVYTMM